MSQLFYSGVGSTQELSFHSFCCHAVPVGAATPKIAEVGLLPESISEAFLRAKCSNRKLLLAFHIITSGKLDATQGKISANRTIIPLANTYLLTATSAFPLAPSDEKARAFKFPYLYPPFPFLFYFLQQVKAARFAFGPLIHRGPLLTFLMESELNIKIIISNSLSIRN